MKKKDGLFKLIKSLTKSEKRFFKVFSSRHVIGGQNNYVELFDAIDKQKVYNEEALLRKFRNKKFANRLAVAKNYLNELILKSMRSYHSQSSIDAQIMELLGSISFLYYKGLYPQAKKVIVRAKKLALEYDKLSIIPEIIKWQKKIMDIESFAGLGDKNVSALYATEQELIQKIDNLNEYWLLEAQLYVQHNRKGMARDAKDMQALEKLMDSPLLNDESQQFSYEAQGMQYRIFATYYFITRDFERCYSYITKLVQHFESRPELIRLDPFNYVNSINNLLNMTSVLGKEEENKRYLGKLQEMVQDNSLRKSKSLELKLFEVYYYHQMNSCIRNSEYDHGMTLLTSVEDGLLNLDHQVDKMGKIMMCFNAFHISFGAGKFAEAEKWIDKVLDNPDHNVREDVYCFSRILLLIVLYESGNEQRLRREMKSTYGYLYKRDKSYHFETMVLGYIREIAKTTNQTQFESLLVKMRTEIQELREHPSERRIFAYFDFLEWINTKIENLSLGQTSDLRA